jgi:hypothetical protein
MLCYVMLCYVMLCYVMLCYVMLCYVMLYVMLCYVMSTRRKDRGLQSYTLKLNGKTIDDPNELREVWKVTIQICTSLNIIRTSTQTLLPMLKIAC